jgi:hypothetical protein
MGSIFFVLRIVPAVQVSQVHYSPPAWRELDYAFGYRGDDFGTSEFD